MKKKYVLKLFLLLSMLCIYMNVMAEEKSTICFFNGRQRNDIKVLVKNGESLMPLRAVSEELGANVDYDNKLKKITITKGEVILSLMIGKKDVIVNNEKVQLINPISTYRIDDQNLTYVPLRILFENLGGTVTYNSKYNYINAYDKEHVAYKALEGLKSDDLTQYRFALLALPRYISDEDVHIGGIYSYCIFPLNAKEPYFYAGGNPSLDLPQINIGYFEVEDGIAVCKWHKTAEDGNLSFNAEEPLIYFYTNKFAVDRKLNDEEKDYWHDQFPDLVKVIAKDGERSIPEGIPYEYPLQSPYLYKYIVKYIGGESEQYENVDLLGTVDEEALMNLLAD